MADETEKVNPMLNNLMDLMKNKNNETQESDAAEKKSYG